MRADLIAAGLQLGYAAFNKTAAPATCGVDIEVPDRMLYANALVSDGSSDGDAAGDHPAKMDTPGAVRSGCKNTLNGEF